jgi:hypothetical protein
MPRNWDARAEQDIGLMIARYLLEHPAPDGSELAADLERWSLNLVRDGQARLAGLGHRRLSAAPPLAREPGRVPR